MSYYAIDFGTSNSLLNYVDDSGKIIEVPLEKNEAKVFRSLFYTPSQNKWHFGKEAIAEYIENDGEGRFFRSVKKFLPEPNYSGTIVHNKKLGISEIVATFLTEMRRRANLYIGKDVTSVIMGRPALYSLDPKEDQLAEDRMRVACELAGFKKIIFCPEPVAAGLDYNSHSKDEKIILIADLGGGTSDFTLMKAHQGKYSKDDILGLSGVFKAGDALDGDMMKNFIAKHLGSQFEYTIPGSENVLNFPRQLLTKICSPAHITHLKEKETWEHLKHIEKFALTAHDKKTINQLFTVVECQLGFPLFEEIEKTKINLASHSEYKYHFKFIDLIIEELIQKEKYQEAIAPTLEIITGSMLSVFEQAGLRPQDVSQVCLTGGTSQLPAIKDYFRNLFGEDRITEYNIYQSVVNGLAQYALKQP